MTDIIQITSLLITISALFAYINLRFIGLPTTIGVMIIALATSVFIYILGQLGFANFKAEVGLLLRGIDFNKTLMHGMLSFLLFAGALHVNLADLRNQKWVILSLATVGVCISTFLVAVSTYYLLAALACHLPFIYCLLFGALISPTDPIAVMATLKRLGVAKNLSTSIAGESLFNDGVGVVVFVVLLLLLQSPGEVSVGSVTLIFLEEAIGGIVFGMVLGGICYYLTNTIDDYKVEVLITLALVMGGYTCALYLHTSGPIAIVVAGLITGSVLRKRSMSDKTRQSVDDFWELIDEILNVVLFALIGLELLIIPFEWQWLWGGLALIPIVILVRAVSVGLPVTLIRTQKQLPENLVKILVWGGLRGGISVALALSLPLGEFRDLVLFLTYVIVVFSIIVQGLSLGPFIRRVTPTQDEVAVL